MYVYAYMYVCFVHQNTSNDIFVYKKNKIKVTQLLIKKKRKKEMLGLKKHMLESRLPEEISVTSDMQMTPPLGQKVKRN